MKLKLLKRIAAVAVVVITAVVMMACPQTAGVKEHTHPDREHSHQPKSRVVTVPSSGWLMCQTGSFGVSGLAWVKIAEVPKGTTNVSGWHQIRTGSIWHEMPAELGSVVYSLLLDDGDVLFEAALDEASFRTVAECRSYWNRGAGAGDRVRLVWWE